MKHDDDIWADTDDWMEPDSEEMREEFPEGFEWSCCQKQIDKPGCEKGKHEAHPDRSKRCPDPKASLSTYAARSEQDEGDEGESGEDEDDDD